MRLTRRKRGAPAPDPTWRAKVLPAGAFKLQLCPCVSKIELVIKKLGVDSDTIICWDHEVKLIKKVNFTFLRI